MNHLIGSDEAELHTSAGSLTPERSGRCGFAVRVIPWDERLVGTLVLGLIAWRAPASNPAEETVSGGVRAAVQAAH